MVSQISFKLQSFRQRQIAVVMQVRGLEKIPWTKMKNEIKYFNIGSVYNEHVTLALQYVNIITQWVFLAK